jgi:hypothetical protein
MIQQVHFKRVFLFLALTFGLTWGFELLVAATIQQPAYLETGLNPMGMFFPAFSALLLQLFVFKDSPLYFRTHKDKTRWVFYSFLLLTVLYGIITLLALTSSCCGRWDSFTSTGNAARSGFNVSACDWAIKTSVCVSSPESSYFCSFRAR